MILVHTFGSLKDGVIQAEIENYDGRKREGEILDSLDLQEEYRHTGPESTYVRYRVVVSGLRSMRVFVVYKRTLEGEYFRVTGASVRGGARKRRTDLEGTILAAWRVDLRNRQKRDDEYESRIRQGYDPETVTAATWGVYFGEMG